MRAERGDLFACEQSPNGDATGEAKRGGSNPLPAQGWFASDIPKFPPLYIESEKREYSNPHEMGGVTDRVVPVTDNIG